MDIKIKTTLITLEIVDGYQSSTTVKEAVNDAIKLHNEVVKEYSPKTNNNDKSN